MCLRQYGSEIETGMKAIQDNNWLYNLLSPLVQFACRCHYNRFVVRGLDNLPTDSSYIIAPCHQQCLMEPLAVLCFAPKAPVFLARADIFRKPAVRTILTFLRILPVYRIRDGQDQLGRNKEIFDRCRDVLLDRYPLCLMAEGRHNNRHHLLPLGKGMFRIAGETQLALGDRPLYIVPTGIDFDEYERPYSNLVVNIGKPIPVQPFMEHYRDNEPLALNQMRDALADNLRPLMHDIRSDEHYDGIMTLCDVLNKEMRRRSGLRNNAWNRFRVRQSIAQRMETASLNTEMQDKFLNLMSVCESLRVQCRRLHLDVKLTGEHWSWLETLLALLVMGMLLLATATIRPLRMVILFCLLCYPIPWLPTHLIMKRKVADPQFRSSFNFGVRFALSIVYALLIGIIMALCEGAWMSQLVDIGSWWGLVAVVVVFVGASLAGSVISFLMNMRDNCRYWLLRLLRHSSMKEIDQTLKTIKDLAS